MSSDDTTAAGSSSATPSTLREELSADASRLGESTKERAKEEAESRKQQVTQTARSASSALGRAADDLEQDESAPGWLSSAFRQTASGIERLAGNVEGRSADELARNITRFARENPVPFLAASAAAGFAAARFLKAGADYRSQHRYEPQGGGGNAGGADTLTGMSTGQGSSQTSPAGYGSNAGAGTAQAGTGRGSTGGYDSSTSSTEPAGYGSNPVQGGLA